MFKRLYVQALRGLAVEVFRGLMPFTPCYSIATTHNPQLIPHNSQPISPKKHLLFYKLQ